MTGRLFELACESAGQNMAIDQAILDEVSESGIPTLRFYHWNAPTLSLGYFQSHQAAQEFRNTKSLDTASAHLSLVRRSTGGGAILHDHELTYSLAMPIRVGQTGAREDLYRDVHAVIATTLAQHGVPVRPFRNESQRGGDDSAFLCFQRRTAEDLVCAGYKILGSAQRRTKSAVLQHGSLLLQASPWAPQLPGISELTSKFLSRDLLAAELASSLNESLGVMWLPQAISDDIVVRANEIRIERYESQGWWEKR